MFGEAGCAGVSRDLMGEVRPLLIFEEGFGIRSSRTACTWPTHSSTMAGENSSSTSCYSDQRPGRPQDVTNICAPKAVSSLSTKYFAPSSTMG